MKNIKNDAMTSGIHYNSYNEKVVEAVIGDARFNFHDFLNKMCRDTMFETRFAEDSVLMASSYHGRAFCNTDEGDSFSLDTGKKIAKSRALEIYYKDFDQRLVDCLEDLRMIEARIYKRLLRSGKDGLVKKARSVQELYENAFATPQKDVVKTDFKG